MTCTQVQDGMKSVALALLSTFPRAGDVSGQRSEIEQSGAERRRGFRYPLPERNARAPRAELCETRNAKPIAHLHATFNLGLGPPRTSVSLCIEIPTRCVSRAVVAVARRVRTGGVRCVARGALRVRGPAVCGVLGRGSAPTSNYGNERTPRIEK